MKCSAERHGDQAESGTARYKKPVAPLRETLINCERRKKIAASGGIVCLCTSCSEIATPTRPTQIWNHASPIRVEFLRNARSIGGVAKKFIRPSFVLCVATPPPPGTDAQG